MKVVVVGAGLGSGCAGDDIVVCVCVRGRVVLVYGLLVLENKRVKR